MNKHLSTLLSGYQDLADRYGDDDPLVRRMKDEIERRAAVAPRGVPVERRHASVPSGIWNRQPRQPSRRP